SENLKWNVGRRLAQSPHQRSRVRIGGRLAGNNHQAEGVPFNRVRAHLPLPLGEGRGEGLLVIAKPSPPAPLPRGEGRYCAISFNTLSVSFKIRSLGILRTRRPCLIMYASRARSWCHCSFTSCTEPWHSIAKSASRQ